MKTPHTPSRGAMKVERDSLGRMFLRRTILTADLANAFLQWQADLLRLGPAALANEAGLIFCAVAFEGISTRQALEGFLRGLKDGYWWDTRFCVEWKIKGWVDRRTLSAMTVKVIKLMADQGLSLDVKRAIKSADHSLNGLDRLLEAAAAWHAMVLPGPLVAHVNGMQPLAALPREVLARGVTGLALVGKEPPKKEFSSLPIGDALEGYFSSVGEDRNLDVAQAIMMACQNGKSKSEIYTKVINLLPGAVLSGPITSIFSTFVLDLIESGTLRKSDLSLTTLGKYPSHIFKHLLPLLQGKHIAGMTTEAWKQIYDAIHANCASSMWGEVSAALGAWHEFLVDWLDVPRVAMIKDADDRPPRANYIWPNEVALIREWLDYSSLEERLNEEIKVAILLLEETRIRTGELLNLRIKNVHLHHRSHLVEIEIAPGKRDSALKSTSARRRVYIRSKAGFEIVEQWLTRRLSMELALRDEFIFGDPHTPNRLYQPGKLIALINRLLKHVTGDPMASLHTFSHTWISQQVSHALFQSGLGEINYMDSIAHEAGHFSNHTSLSHYSHLFESALRHHLDQSLIKIRITSNVASRWAGVKADAIRARVARARKVNPNFSSLNGYWKMIMESGSLHLPNVMVESKVALARPQMPAFLPSTSTDDYDRVLHTLQDLSSGLSIEAVSLRNSRPHKWVEKISSCAGMILRAIEVKNIPLNFKNGKAFVLPDEAVRILQRIGERGSSSGFDFGAVAQPKLKPLLKFLQNANQIEGIGQQVFAWQRAWDRGYISIMDPKLIEDLVCFVLNAGLPVSAMGLVVERMNARADESAAAMSDTFLLRCGVAPQKIYVQPKSSRPSAYLVLSSVAIDARTFPPKASASTAGMNALLLAAATYQGLVGLEGDQ